MTILADIWKAIGAAEKLPFALELGVSGQHAFDAAAHWVEMDGSGREKDILLIIRQLKRVETPFFDGWNLLCNDYTNPFHARHRRGGSAA